MRFGLLSCDTFSHLLNIRPPTDHRGTAQWRFHPLRTLPHFVQSSAAKRGDVSVVFAGYTWPPRSIASWFLTTLFV